jgi:small subunit ribosomal protein S25e
MIKGTCSNWRQEAEEEVVEGQGYVTSQHSYQHLSPSWSYPRKTQLQRLLLSWHRALRHLAYHQATTNRCSVKDKAQHAVVLDKQTNDKLQKDVQSYRLITVATLVDRLKINGSLARKALADLEANGQIKKVVGHSKLSIYSMLHQRPCYSTLVLAASRRVWKRNTDILQHEQSAQQTKRLASE